MNNYPVFLIYIASAFREDVKMYEQGVSVNPKGGYKKRKWEILTANYII